MARRGDPVTVRGVADTARVSRSWIYQQRQLLAEIDRFRQPRPRNRPGVPARKPLSTRRQQLHIYREEITRLRNQITDLHEQLARQPGDARTAAITGRTTAVQDMSMTPRP